MAKGSKSSVKGKSKKGTLQSPRKTVDAATVSPATVGDPQQTPVTQQPAAATPTPAYTPLTIAEEHGVPDPSKTSLEGEFDDKPAEGSGDSESRDDSSQSEDEDYVEEDLPGEEDEEDTDEEAEEEPESDLPVKQTKKVKVSKPSLVADEIRSPKPRSSIKSSKRGREGASQEFIVQPRLKRQTTVGEGAGVDFSTVLLDDGSDSDEQVPSILHSGQPREYVYIYGGEKSTRFYSANTEERYKLLRGRPLWGERRVDVTQPEARGLFELLQKQQYMGTLFQADAFEEELVYEFYSNMHPRFNNDSSAGYGMSFVRGRIVRMDSERLNALLDTPSHDPTLLENVDVNAICSTLTGGVVTSWPTNNAQIRVSDLAPLYSMLFKISMFNWIPTKHPSNIGKHQGVLLYAIGNSIPVNFGHLIFNQIKTRAASATTKTGTVAKFSLIFPCLIYSFLISQGIAKPPRSSLVNPRGAITFSHDLLKAFIGGTGDSAPKRPPVPHIDPITGDNYGPQIMKFLRRNYDYHHAMVREYEVLFATLADCGPKGGDVDGEGVEDVPTGAADIRDLFSPLDDSAPAGTVQTKTGGESSHGKRMQVPKTKLKASPAAKGIKITEGKGVATRARKAAADVSGKGKKKIVQEEPVKVPDDEEEED